MISGAPTFTCGTDVNVAGVDRYIDYFRELDRLPETGGGLDHAAVAEIMMRYETETFRP